MNAGTAVSDARFHGLSCYTSNVAYYLASEFGGVEAYLADSIRLAVRTDLGDGQLAFSHHRSPLNRMPDGTELAYAFSRCADECVAGISDELRRYGRCLVVTDNANLPWSPSYGSDAAAPHWLLVDDGDADRWHAIDAFTALLPTGEQRPYAGWLSTAELLDAMTLPARWSPEQDRRTELAFGFPLPAPGPGFLQWFRRDAASSGSGDLSGRWLFTDDAVLPFIAEYIVDDPIGAERHLDDLWTVAKHRAFCHRYTATRCAGPRTERLAAAESAWLGLPGALRFAVNSARRGRPRDSLVRTTMSHLLELELEMSAGAVVRPVHELLPDSERNEHDESHALRLVS